MTSATFRVGMSTFGFIYRASLEESLEFIAEAGYTDVEIAPIPPHMLTTTITDSDLKKLRARLDALGLRVVSINPAEMNLISPNTELRELCLRQYRAAARVLAELGGEVVMVVPGRQNGLIPMPEPQALDLFRQQLESLLEEAEALGVDLALETTPFGFLGSAASLAEVVDEFDNPRLGIAVDVANILPRESITDAIKTAGRRLKMAQFSDTWHDRWAHTAIGRGDIDFDELRTALVELEYTGPCIYELVDGEDPVPRIGPDLLTLEASGWTR